MYRTRNAGAEIFSSCVTYERVNYAACKLRYELFCFDGRRAGVWRVSVSANLVREGLGDWSAADHDLDLAL